jgi:hypothetical protein
MTRAIPKLLREIDDVYRYFVEELGYEKYDALWEITECIATGLFRITRQKWIDGSLSKEPLGNPETVDGSYFFDNYTLGSDHYGRATVVSRRYEWCDYHWTIDERCDVRTLCPPSIVQTVPPKAGRRPDYEIDEICGVAKTLAENYIKGGELPNSANLFREKVGDACSGAKPKIRVPGDTRFKEIVDPIYKDAKQRLPVSR